MGAIYLTQLPPCSSWHMPITCGWCAFGARAEQTELRVEYLFSAESLAEPGFDIRNVVDFTNT